LGRAAAFGLGYYGVGYPYYAWDEPYGFDDTSYASDDEDGYDGSAATVASNGCAERYRSYDPASGTYLGYDGQRHPCE
jgi:hypothetical protein